MNGAERRPPEGNSSESGATEEVRPFILSSKKHLFSKENAPSKSNFIKLIHFLSGGPVTKPENDALFSDIQLQRQAPLRGEELLTLVEGSMPGEANLRLEVTLVPPREKDAFLRVGLRIGSQKWYVVKDIPRFLEAWRRREALPFQSRFIYDPVWMHFSVENERILRALDRLVSAWRMRSWLPPPSTGSFTTAGSWSSGARATGWR